MLYFCTHTNEKKGVTSHPLHVTKAIFLNDRRNECDISLDSVLLLLWCEALGAVGFPPTSCGYPLLCRLVSLSSFVETIGSVQSVCVCARVDSTSPWTLAFV